MQKFQSNFCHKISYLFLWTNQFRSEGRLWVPRNSIKINVVTFYFIPKTHWMYLFGRKMCGVMLWTRITFSPNHMYFYVLFAFQVIYVCLVAAAKWSEVNGSCNDWIFVIGKTMTLHPVVINLIYSIVLSHAHQNLDSISSYWMMDRELSRMWATVRSKTIFKFSSLVNLIMLDRAWQNNYTNVHCYLLGVCFDLRIFYPNKKIKRKKMKSRYLSKGRSTAAPTKAALIRLSKQENQPQNTHSKKKVKSIQVIRSCCEN